jgi:hypothetical protein
MQNDLMNVLVNESIINRHPKRKNEANPRLPASFAPGLGIPVAPIHKRSQAPTHGRAPSLRQELP